MLTNLLTNSTHYTPSRMSTASAEPNATYLPRKSVWKQIIKSNTAMEDVSFC